MGLRVVCVCAFAVSVLTVGCDKKEPAARKTATPAAQKNPAPSQPAPTVDSGPVRPFNGKDTSGWAFEGRPNRNFWKVGTAAVDPANDKTLLVDPAGDQLINAGIVGSNILTERKFKDFTLELEFMLPPNGNSGIFLLGQYELQVLHDPAADPKNPTDMDVGGVARLVAPKVLVPITPGHWHTYEINFRAPRFDTAGKKSENARLVRVTIDGVVVHQDTEIPGPTPGSLIEEKEVPEGPLLLQGSEGPVAYRNIVVTPGQ